MSETGIVERLRESIGDSFTPDPRFDDCQEAASLIERQQKAIDLLLKAIEPFAISEKGAWPDCVTLKFAPCPFTYGEVRAARSAKEQAERILKGEES